jgi:hypothetical protein
MLCCWLIEQADHSFNILTTKYADAFAIDSIRLDIFKINRKQRNKMASIAETFNR